MTQSPNPIHQPEASELLPAPIVNAINSFALSHSRKTRAKLEMVIQDHLLAALSPPAQVGTSGASAEVSRLVEGLKLVREVLGHATSFTSFKARDSYPKAMKALDAALATMSSPAAKVGTEDADAQATPLWADDRESITHALKTDPKAFADVVAGRKTFEIRKADRDYRAGDRIVLRCTTRTGEEIAAGWPLEYTGAEWSGRITGWLTGYGLMDGHIALSIKPEFPTAPQPPEAMAPAAPACPFYCAQPCQHTMPLLAAPVAAVGEAVGEPKPPEWTARRSNDGCRIVIDSADFEHDATLTLYGDFEGDAQKLWFAGAIADKLNAAPQPRSSPLTATASQLIAAHTYLRGCEIDMAGAELDTLLSFFGIVPDPYLQTR